MSELTGQKLKKLDLPSKNVFWKTAKVVANGVLEKGNVGRTLRPFARLFVLRRMKELIGGNQLLTTEKLIDEIGIELTQELEKFSRNSKETSYSETATTIGLEIQPVVGKKPMPMLVDKKEIAQIVRFSGLGSSFFLDKPFEIILTPSVNPMTQALMLREILYLTGIDIQRAGVQVNFGGIGKEKKNILALQRIILSAGRLRPPQGQFEKFGNFWKLNEFEGKGEVNVRKGLNLTVKRVLPRKFDQKGFKRVAEVRVPVGAESFFVFVRGLLAAHGLANMVRASEQTTENSGVWENLCGKFDLVLKQVGLPGIQSEWLRDNWKTFAKITQNSDNGLRRVMTNFFSS